MSCQPMTRELCRYDSSDDFNCFAEFDSRLSGRPSISTCTSARKPCQISCLEKCAGNNQNIVPIEHLKRKHDPTLGSRAFLPSTGPEAQVSSSDAGPTIACCDVDTSTASLGGPAHTPHLLILPGRRISGCLAVCLCRLALSRFCLTLLLLRVVDMFLTLTLLGCTRLDSRRGVGLG